MVFGMNTIAFGDDIAETTAAADETAEVAASTNGTLDHFNNISGLGYNKDGYVVTEISYATNGAKKNAEDNVATITKVSDPVSWNNFRGRNLIATVLYGNNKNDEYLNNKAKLSVSSTDMDDYLLPGIVHNGSSFFDVVKVQDGVYLFVGYSLEDGDRDYVAGQDDVVSDPLTDYVQVNSIPVRAWDGRKIAFNKSGKNNATASNIEALNVDVALVKYEGNTVTELNGASVANVKIDKKATKKASVAYATTEVEKAGKVISLEWDAEKGALVQKEKDDTTTIDEHATLGDLPSFTIKVKLDKNVKTYGRDLKTALKDKKYFFGIMQRGITVTDPTKNGAYRSEYFGDNAGKHWSYD